MVRVQSLGDSDGGAARKHGVRRGYRGRGSGRAFRSDSLETSCASGGARIQRLRGGERLRGRRAYSFGRLIDPTALDELIPDWKARGAPLDTEVNARSFLLSFRPAGTLRIPHFLCRPHGNRGNYIASLGLVYRWLAGEAEALGVEIYPGFAAVDVEWDFGRSHGRRHRRLRCRARRHHKESIRRAWRCGRIHAGRGGCARLARKQLIARFGLAEGRAPQTFGLGLKELWELPEDMHLAVRRAHVRLAARQPYRRRNLYLPLWGGLVAVGFVVHLDYENPYLSPFDEFQRFKTHPLIRPMLEGGGVSAMARARSPKEEFRRCPSSSFRAAPDRLRRRM